MTDMPTDLDALAELIALCRRSGVVHLRLDALELTLGPEVPAPRAYLDEEAEPTDVDAVRYAHTHLRPPNLRALRGES